MVDKDRIQGSAEQAKGKVKEVIGKVTGDSRDALARFFMILTAKKENPRRSGVA